MTPTPWTPSQYAANLLRPLGAVTTAMERTGVPVDLERLASIESRARAEEGRLRRDLDAWAGREVNWGSVPQLRAFLHDDEDGLRLDPSPHCKTGDVKVDEGEVSTDDRALEYLAGAHPQHRAGIQALRDLRKAQRVGNYAASWRAIAVPHPDGTHRLHPTFGLGSDSDSRPGAKTGRFALKNTGAGGLNQVPKVGDGLGGELREAFVAPPGCRLVVRDYSQLEVVELAHLTLGLFGPGPLSDLMAAGADIHGRVAKRAFGELGGDEEAAAADYAAFKTVPRLKVLRNLAKIVLYGNNYGKGEAMAAQSIYLPDGSPLGLEKSRLLYAGLRETLPETGRYQDFIRAFIEEHGYIVSLFGRVMPLPGAKARRLGDRNRAWRQALNYPLQAGGQEVMGLALIAAATDPRMVELGFTPDLVVHDELMGWAPEDRAEEALALLGELMETAVTLRVPLKTEGHTGSNWAEAK